MKQRTRNLSCVAAALALWAQAFGHGIEPIEFNAIGIPYAWNVELEPGESTATPPDHVGAWSWDEDGFPETARGWTHTSKWVKLLLSEPTALRVRLTSLDNVPWPSNDDPARLAGTNLFPSFTLYRGWDTDAGRMTNTDGSTLDQDHTFNNRGNIEWAEDVTYLDHLDNSTAHEAERVWHLPSGKYTLNLGGNSPATVAEGRQGYRATFFAQPTDIPVTNAVLAPVSFSGIGIPYAWSVVMGANGMTQTLPDHVGAWSWDEDGFPETARGWTHTSKWVKLHLTEPALFTLTLASKDGVPWPSNDNPARLAGTNLFPSFSIYRGWDTDAGLMTNADGTTLDQDHTFNNRGNIDWAEDVTYLDHLDNSTTHQASRTWLLPAGEYTLNLGGNSPVTVAEGRQGYVATFTTAPAPVDVADSALTPVSFSGIGIPYAWSVVMGANGMTQTLPDHVGAWSWDEDGFPETARGWTHTSKWVKLHLTEPALFTLTLASKDGVPWPSNENPARLAGTNLFPSFSIYRGWDTDAGLMTNADGTTLDQDHTFNNRGNIDWAEDVTYLDHLDNSSEHTATKAWHLPAGRYTINLGGNSPVTVAEGRQGYLATFTTRPTLSLTSGRAIVNYDEAVWKTLASGQGTPPVLTLSAFFDQAEANSMSPSEILTNVQTGFSYLDQEYRMNGSLVTNLPGRTTQPTTFTWVAGDVTLQSGSIGLGGIARFAVFGGAAGSVLFGDFTLQYDTARKALGGSGWYLKGNIPPAAAAYDLLEVTVEESSTTLFISGKLGVSAEVANFLFNTPSDALRTVGSFQFVGSTATLTEPTITRIAVSGDQLKVEGANGLPGTPVTLLGAGSLSAASGAWSAEASGVFDATGRCTISVPIRTADSERYFRLAQP